MLPQWPTRRVGIGAPTPLPTACAWRTSPPSSASPNACPSSPAGLGILAGDHLKSASDLGIPLTGVGLLYQQGYFRQYLNQGGWQQEDYASNDFRQPARHADVGCARNAVDGVGRISRSRGHGADLEGRSRPRRCSICSTPTSTTTSPPTATSRISSTAATGRCAFKQEILLGIGGYRALAAPRHCMPTCST